MSEKTVVQKLLIKEGYRVLIVNAPEGYVASLGDLPAGVAVATDLDQPRPVRSDPGLRVVAGRV